MRMRIGLRSVVLLVITLMVLSTTAVAIPRIKDIADGGGLADLARANPLEDTYDGCRDVGCNGRHADGRAQRQTEQRAGELSAISTVSQALVAETELDSMIQLIGSQMREIFEAELAPLFENRHIRWLLNKPSALFGLGIPPSQFEALKGDEQHMAKVLRERLERLACGFDLAENYFAWQAFGLDMPDLMTVGKAMSAGFLPISCLFYVIPKWIDGCKGSIGSLQLCT